jgi:hypothetical protein
MSNAHIYQDNKSTILLENNCKMLSSKRTKHIKAKFFFITDRIEHGEIIIVEHMPTDQMWIDVNTKPKQGLPIRKDRAMIMNCPVDLPDETLVRHGADVLKKVRFSDEVMAPKISGVTDEARGSKIPVQVGKAKPTKRLQECVGDPTVFGFQVEPKPRTASTWWRTRGMAPAIPAA